MTSVRVNYSNGQIDSQVGPVAGALVKFLELQLQPIIRRLEIIEKKLGIAVEPEQAKDSKPPATAPVPKKKNHPNPGDRVIGGASAGRVV